MFYTGNLSVEDTSHLFSKSRLIRTETTTLLGLMMRAPIDFTLPTPDVFSDYIATTRKLLKELHHAILAPLEEILLEGRDGDQDFNPFTSGKLLREPIFYGPESAYYFQYRDLAPRKYREDARWLLHNRGIDLVVGREVSREIPELLNERLLETLDRLKGQPTAIWTVLPGFTLTCEELANRLGRPRESVRAIVDVFSLPETESNAAFTSIHAFNVAYAYPLIRTGPDEFISLLSYDIAEALYESPFYWMYSDEAYIPIALRHRGKFTEEFSAERLAHVFGADRVFRNVEIRNFKRRVLGEMDALVVFGDRAIVLQAKSKKLTLLARRGNDLQLRSDFKAAVQDSVDQAFHCADLLGDPAVTLHRMDGTIIPSFELPSTIFPLSVVADHYPALAFQARQFLKTNTNERIHPPLVIDVFGLDAITEMLNSPLRLLSYLALRSRFGDSFWASHELTLLSYHLKRNLWAADDVDLVMLEDDIAADLDIAMAVRRDGMSGERTPDGILTRFEGTPFSNIIAQIEDLPDAVAIDLGLGLLELGEDTVNKINEYTEKVVEKTALDGGLHDMTIGISKASFGLTIHCSLLDDRAAEIRLQGHCAMRKYSQKADRWFGIALRPNGKIQLAAKLIEPWKFDREMETLLEDSATRPLRRQTQGKIGRNHPCPCGSGKKYKRCCITR
ncbi:MAG: SEC-C metal-binding domain-containing protein [Gammaproteobacteria bacterium]|nr:SEC-C metal-binding domain-containing protein [Gammaproteobacteria bacterium]